MLNKDLRARRKQRLEAKAKAPATPYFGTPFNDQHGYGKFHCAKCSKSVLANAGEEMYCPICAEIMKSETTASVEDVKALKLKNFGKCSVCNSALASTEHSAKFCPQCGTPFVKAQDEEELEEGQDEDEKLEEGQDDLMDIQKDKDKVQSQDEELEEGQDMDEDELEGQDEDEKLEGQDDLVQQAQEKVEELKEDLEQSQEELEKSPDDEDLQKSCEYKTAALKTAVKVLSAVKKMVKAQEDENEEMKDEAQEELEAAEEELDELEKGQEEEEKLDEGQEELEAPVAYITPITAKDTFTSADVSMALFNETSEDPFWNVTIKGNPVARIALSRQPRPDEIRDAFVSSDYAQNVANAIEKLGAESVLSSINAEFFANKVEQTDLAAKIRSKVLSDVDAEYKQKLAGMKDEFLHCVGIVLAGANKNFFSDADHVLKAALWQNLKEAGVDDAMDHIEAAFETSGNEFFQWVIDKAVAFMEKPKEALSEIAKAIGGANQMPPDRNAKKEEAEGEDETLAERLARGSVPIKAQALDISTTSKEEIRKAIALRRR